VGADLGRDADRALSLLFSRCRDDRACRDRYPDPERDFREVLARLERRPEKVRARHPATGERLDLTVDADRFRQVVLGFLYQAETAALLPALVREARDGDLAPIASQALLVASDIQAGLSRPLQLSVLCSEDVPFYPMAPAAEEGRSFLGGSAREAFERACADWPRGQVDPQFHRAAPMEVPALLISGEADPVTPPSWAELAAISLPRSRAVTLPGQGHGNFGRGCMPRIVAEFVKRGSAEGLDAACLARVRPAPVFIDLLGSSP